MSRKNKTRYLAQPCHDGRWWVLKIKNGGKPTVVIQHVTEQEARDYVQTAEENR